MSFSDWTKKRKQDQQTATVKSGSTTAAGGTQATVSPPAANIARDDKPSSFSEWTRKSKGVTAWRDEEVGFNSWLDQMNNFSSEAGSAYQGYTGDAYQSADAVTKYRDDTYRSLDTLSKQGQDYRTYFQAYKSMYDELYGEETTQKILSALDDGGKYLEDLRGGVDSVYNFWTQFQDEDDYNTYQKGKEYAAITEAPDFAEKSQYQSTANGQEKFNAWSGTYTNSGFDDIAYDYINRNEEARSRQQLTDIQSNASLLGLDNSERQEMTDDEIATFNYLYAQDTANGDTEHKNAYAYIDFITGDLNYRQRAKAEEEWAAYANEHPVGSSVFSVLESPLKGLSYIGQAADYLSDGKIDQNEGYNKFSYLNSAIRNEVNGIVEENWGGVGSFAYQTGMSMGDFLFNTAITGGNQALSLAIMGTGAAADTVIASKDAGLTDNRAFVLGTIAGAAEIVTEKISLEALLDKTTLGRDAVGYLVKNVLAEGSEEGLSDVINWTADWLYDVLASQEQSEWKRMIASYEAEGMSEDEATKRAVADRAKELGLDVLGGAVSGGVMAGAGVGINSGLNAYTNYQTGKEFQAMGDDVVQATIQEGLASAPSTRSYQLAQQLQQKLDAGQTLTETEIGQLYQANIEAVNAEESSEELLLRAAEEVTQKGRVTNNTAADILDNPSAMTTLAQEAGLNIREDMSKSQQRKAVKAAVEGLARSQDGISANTRETTPAAAQTQQTATQRPVATEQYPQGARHIRNEAEPQTAVQRTVAQQAYDMGRVRKAADSLGENGAKALSASYDGSVQVDDYYAGFANYYEAGISGMDMKKVQSQHAAQLTEAQKFAAYSAGQNDAVASLALERRAAQYAKVAGSDSGLVFDDYVAKSLNSDTAAKVNSVAKALGVRVRFVDSVRGGTANAQISGSDILVEKNNPNPVMFLVGHEMTHRMQELAPEQYRAFRNAVAAEAQGEARVLLEQYQRAGENIRYEEALDEAAANYAGRMIENGEVLDNFIEQHRRDRTLLEKVRDAIRSVIAKLTGAEKRKAQTAEGKLTVALDAASKQATTLQGKGDGATMTTTRNSLKEDSENGREEAAHAGTFGNLQGEARKTDSRTGKAEQRVRGELSNAAGRHGGVNPSFGAKPVRSWAEGHTVEPARGSVAYVEQQTAMEYGVPSFVVSDAVYAKNKSGSPAFSVGGQIYFKETLPEGNRGMFAPHEITHVMRQVGYAPYLDFVDRTPTMLNMSDPVTRILLDHVAKHQRTTLEDANPTRLYDEFNATMYGHIAAEKAEMFTTGIGTGVFHNFAAYAEELAAIHEQFKQHNQKETKFSLKEYTDEEKKQHIKDAADHFGRTYKWTETGYVTTDGRRLDFSGRHDGGPGGYRTVDHRDIREALGDDYGGDDYSGSMVQFMSEGNIRISPEVGGINLSVMPTKAQMSTLSDFISKQRGEVILDLDTLDGRTVSSTEYPRGTHANKVLADIKEYFENGTTPYVSEMAQFRYSLKTDSKGRKLTYGQREYFKDSKVVDGDGRLKVMYRGGNGDFTVFDRRKSSYANLYGRGFYFTDSEAHAAQYGNPRAFYLNITNPVSTDETTITRSQMRKFLNAVAENEDDYSFENYGYEATVDSVLKSTYGKSDFAMLYDVSQTAIGDMVAAVELFNEVNGTDYDGLILDTETVAFRSDQIKNTDNQNPTDDPDIRYSLKPVPPVQPQSEDWRPGATFDEVKTAHPTLFALDADEADTRNPTQISGTVKSYRKIYDALKAEGFDGTILDASSGLGCGTRAGREEYGFDVDDIEPFPDAKYKPDYTDYSTLDKTYDVIINNAVLNVMPQDLRDALVVKMGEMLNPGGRAFINVRGTDVKNASSKVAINDDLMEYFISNTGSYQKGFTQRELVAYLKDALGGGFSVEPTKKFGGVSAIVTRDPANFSLKGSETARETAKLREENELLRERVDYWKGQTKRTTRVTTDKKAVAKAAKQLVESYGADIAAENIQGDLQSLYDYLASGYDGKDELTWEESYRRARNIARKLVENAVAVDDTMYEQYSDLRDYLRTTKIVYGKEYQGDIPDFNDFRKRNFGRLNLGSEGATNIDQVYQEMSSLWPEFFDEQAQNHPTDQLLHIAEVLDGLYDITEYNPFSQYMDQAVTGAANEIMEQFFDLPQTRKTFADRQAAKLDAAKAKGRQQVQQVREERDAKLAALREENRERVKNAINRERQTRARQINALKDRYAAKDAKGRQQRAARELRGKIVRHAKALSQKLLRPSDKQHIPESLRGAVAAMLESINLESQYSINEDGRRAKGDDGAPVKRTEAFRALKEQYAKIASEGGGGLVIDPSLLGSDAEGIQGSFDAVIAMKDTKLADMSAEQLATVWQVVKAVEHSVNTAGKVLSKAKYARTADWAQAISTDSGSRRAKTSLTKNHALIDLETPYTFFSHYGEAGKAVYRMLRDAQDQQQLMVDHVAEEVRKIVDPKTVKKLEETTRTFTTERGEELTLSTAQVMELHELMKRKQAHDHLLKGGIVQPEVKSAKIRRGTDSILLTAGDLANITGTLTAEQVKIADGLQGLTCGLLADYGNRASMDAYGYKKFTEKDYWPIKSAKEGLHANIEKGGSNTRSIKNIGMAKTTMPHASNALDLAGIFATFSNHAADMTDYASWLCTMEDANRLFNYQFRDEEGNLTGKTIKGLLDRVGGPGSQKYWHNLMEDIQNGINAPGDSPMWDIFGRTIGSFKGAAVGANARVVIQQPTAFFRAAAVLNPTDMTRGLARGATKGNGWKKALQYSPIAMRKDAGGFDISSPYQMSETLFDNRTRVRKLNDTLSAPAGAADAVTWGKLWNACEWATARNHQSLAKGSEAFYKQTAKLFAEVIDQTQVVDGVLQRSNIMRSSNAVVKQATSFMGEPIMSLNLLMRSYDQMRYEQDNKKRGRAIKTLGRAATALVVTNVVNALAQSVIDAMRDDDEDKKYWERFWSAFTGLSGDEESAWDKAWNAVMEGNVGSNMNPLGQIPFVKDALSIIQGYDVSRTEMEIVSDLIQAGQTAIQSADGNGKKTRAYATKGLLAAGAKMFGIPASNLARDMWGLVRSVAVETDNIPLQYEMEKAIYNITNAGNYTRYYDILYRALEVGDNEVYEHIYADMVANGIPEDKIRSGMESRMKKAQGVDSVTDLESRFLSPSQTESYERVYDRVTGSAAWSAANAEQRETLEDDLYDLTVGNSDGVKLQEKIDGGAVYGIDETDYLLYRLALHIVDQPSESGKLGSYTGEEVEAAIDMLPGLDDEARAYLWAAAGKSEKSNPYK